MKGKDVQKGPKLGWLGVGKYVQISFKKKKKLEI